ncbi:thiamine pyrophosphate-binding protein [Verminephrobacter eiseniae]|uniref:thiamine pyrophosphate-binding protein n=1 Tax=Verminephrobacter eiseniae TaxID=364317 RepID=UPI0010D0FBAE|nr:thiamine pyrophosphate-binding protein [Verminephrobacter eiseniae]KAB7571614.1 hypothetical protein ET532_020740 [Verminephrobacter sp. Larva24]MCW5229814.1 hypothetical protein [Verminephrobacter eiseniae]MCW5291545.1 hypothetical protein [Verminephrobacter eiseniae]MCW8186450.1 hypothetical protein [Verminephrobacter eiseniae]MCW8222876.1 hypothetical protein [Verminephrobacter eiseniae]
MKRAADRLIEPLVRHGVDRVFHVPGESCLGVLDGLADGSPPVTADMSAATCRHESAAGVMARADACLTEGALRQALACGRAAVLAVRARLEHASAAAHGRTAASPAPGAARGLRA